MAIPIIKRETVRLLPLYALGLLVAFFLKLYYSRAGADGLDWILAPTCRLAGLLSGIPFEREPGIGWITRSHRMIVGPACAGINFLIVAFCALCFPFLRRLAGAWARFVWLPASLALAALFTVVTNSLRLIVAVRLHEMGAGGGLLTPARAHRLEGTVIYCAAILLAFFCVDRIFGRFEAPRQAGTRAPSALVPLGWYLAVTLGVPLVTLSFRGDGGRLPEHAGVVVSVCLLAAIAAFLSTWLARRAGRIKTRRRGKLPAPPGGDVSTLAGC
jgi:exosortase K